MQTVYRRWSVKPADAMRREIRTFVVPGWSVTRVYMFTQAAGISTGIQFHEDGIGKSPQQEYHGY
jgi:hypothetical protein